MVAAILAVKLILMNVIGFGARKLNIVDGNFTTKLSNFLMKVCIPCLIFNSICSSVAFSVEALANCALTVVVAMAVMVLSLSIGQVFYLLNHRDGMGRIIRFGMTFCHFSFMGIPVVEALLGSEGTFYYAFFLLPVRIIYYALCQRLMTPAGGQTQRKSPGKAVKDTLLNPCMIAVILGVLFWLLGLRLPEILDYCVKTLSTISSPMALLLCGMVIGGYELKSLLRWRCMILPVLRAALIPAVFLGLSKLLALAGVSDMLCQMVVIYAALPVSSLLPVYAVQYDPDPENHLYAAGSSVFSVVVSAVTIPLWYALL